MHHEHQARGGNGGTLGGSPTAHGVTFTRPVLVAHPGNLCTLFSSGTPPRNLALLDKDWISWDQSSRTLVVSYSRIFLNRGTGAGQIEIKRVRVPANPTTISPADVGTPIVVAPEISQVQNGAYTVQAPGGATYVAWERNLESNIGNGDPYIYEQWALVPAGASRPTVGEPADR